MKRNDLTLRKLNNTDFPRAYEEFLLEKNMNRGKYVRMLALATLFINSLNGNIRKLGYRIIVIYCNRTNDYKPLYDVAVNSGLIPVAHFIEDKIMGEQEGNVFVEMNAAFSIHFVINNIYCSLQQKKLIDFYDKNIENSLSVVAPTSYGKTDLIMSTVRETTDKNICVITPTKSLLAQTKMRIIKDGVRRHEKIITHPEMYIGNEERVIAIMTQERVLRLLRKVGDLQFDYVIIDEAHGLLHDDDRNMLLASVILVLEKRNPDTVFKFLTPFLCDAENIKVRYADYILKSYKVEEYIKTEKFYVAELRNSCAGRLALYDQFMNKFYDMGFLDEVNTEWEFVKRYADRKNIVYLNKPKDIEALIDIINKEKMCDAVQKIEEACKNIAEYVHPKYRMIQAIQRGVIYHHGAVPEPIRMYVEKLYAEIEIIKYVVTSSTLLEGVNLPADKMFILDNKKGKGRLNPSDFKNLIGRVCRFSQIFHPETGSLSRLEPSVYLVAGKYFSSNANVENFISESMYVEKKVHDEIENVLLEKTVITDENKEKYDSAREFVENYEEGIINNYDLRKTKTEIGKACFLNNVTELDIFESEEYLDECVRGIKEADKIIDDTKKLFSVLYKMFFSRITDDRIKRFEYEETRNFYKMFMDWRITNTSLNQMISSFMRYWKGVIESGKETLIFVGRWGDITRSGQIPLWTDIKNKTEMQMVNLAIVRIKEEQDFLDNVVIKYVEVLNDMKLLEENLYVSIKYGTNDRRIITCTKNGISLSLAKIIVEKYLDYIQIDVENDTLQFRDGIIEAMKKAKENEILICELQYFL